MPMPRAHTRRPSRHAHGAVLLPAILLAAMPPQPAAAQPAAVTQEATALPELNVNAGLPRGHGPVRGYVAGVSATATKTDTPLLETPQSLSVVTRDQIEAQAAQNLNGALRYTPGIATDTRGAVALRLDQFSVRGFTVPQFLDGMRLFGGRDANPSVDFYRLERIDVLRGPASVMYGQASPGGVVNLVSKRPTETPQRELLLQGGSYGTFRGGLDLSGALNEDRTILGRVVGSYYRSDTQIEQVEEERFYLAPSVTFRPTTDTSITLLGLYQRDPQGGSYGSVPAYGSVLGNPNGRVATNRWDGNPGFDRLNRTQYQVGYLAEHRFNDAFTLRQNFRYAHSEGYYRQLYGTFGANLLPDFRTVQRSTTGSDVRFDTVTVDTHLQSKFDTGPLGHTLLTGVDYYNTSSRTFSGFDAVAPAYDLYAPNFGSLAIRPLTYQTNARQTQNSLGFYGQDQIRIGRVALQLGGRYDRYDSATETETFATRRTTRSEQEVGAFTGRAGLVYLFDNGLAPYLSYAESFEPQSGTFAPARGAGAFEPTTGRQYEAGLRYQPPGTNALFSAAVFDLTRQNVLTTDPNDNRYSVQTGEVRSRGVELEAKASLATGLEVVGAFTWLDHEVTSSNATVTENRGIAGAPTPTRPEKGTTPVGVPSVLGSVWANYSFQPDTALEGAGLGGGLRYVGSSWGDTANTLKVPDYTLVDLTARYNLGKLGAANTELQLNVSNLFDKEYVSTCNTYAWCWYGFRRSVIATLRHRF
ncbi:TonB-dependent siderophore receptor [Paeniroseomonas aquatica]|uniref:TonB-dependent siderophore receptor n=1 Tax=Paeniroseomonas aquatica TaxID=373043 RepID=A0ABT8AAA4_9PROT|nr:TonB-dependent siderophore receptor [Paeniroseomonas aquatica]MDN3566546.1 TonB-dependent siderophore receptor [Paeniroseomonas aquatica]